MKSIVSGHIPKRMCTGCRQMYDKINLIRVVKDLDTLLIDKEQKIQKRGAYICKNEKCIALVKKKKILNKLIKKEVSEEFFEELIEFAKR